MFVGVGAARPRPLRVGASKRPASSLSTSSMRSAAPGTRAACSAGTTRRSRPNQLLVELDGFDAAAGIVLLAATNRPEISIPRCCAQAALTPGAGGPPDRLGTRADPTRPPEEGRRRRGRPGRRAGRPAHPGFTGADLANLVNEAALVATRRQSSRSRWPTSPPRSSASSPGSRSATGFSTPRAQGRGVPRDGPRAGRRRSQPGPTRSHKGLDHPARDRRPGTRSSAPPRTRFLMTRGSWRRSCSAFGDAPPSTRVRSSSRPAPPTIFGRATEIARSMVTRFGMAPELGHVVYDREPQASGLVALAARERSYGEETAREIDCAVRAIAWLVRGPARSSNRA